MEQVNYYNSAPDKNFNLLKILYYIKAGLILFLVLFFAIYAFIGAFLQEEMANDMPPDMPFNFADLFIIIGVIGIVLCLIAGILNIMAASYLKQRKNYTFIIVVAALNCLGGLLGMALGVFTILELSKPEVKALFKQSQHG